MYTLSLVCSSSPQSLAVHRLFPRLDLQSRKPDTLSQKVLVKCRQNVANKLFISRYFNPVVPVHLYVPATN